MAINTQKFLPSSKGGAIAKFSKKVISTKSSSIDIGEKSLTDLSVIKVKVIEIDSILKGTLAIEKKQLNDKKKETSSKRREKLEEKLETKPKAEKGKIQMPKTPRMGFLDWVKNFIGNIILGYFAVRLVDHLPKIIPFVKFIGQATDLVINFGGKLLDGLVTFIDWGYKAYDATRGFAKNLFGNDGAKQFDQLSTLLNQFLNLALIAGMAAAGSGGFGGRGPKGSGARPRPGRGGRPKVTTSGGGRAGGIDIRNPLRQKPKVSVGRGGNRALLSSVRPFLKRVPLPVVGALIDFGLSWALGENPGRAAFRAIGAGILGTIGGGLAGALGLAGGPLAIATAALGSIAGGTLGDMAGGALYDLFFGGRSAKSSTKKMAGGGITRGGKTQGKTRRSIGGKTKRRKYKRALIPRKPGEVEATSPGADVGGEEKLFGIFPNPFKKVIDEYNPFKNVIFAQKNLGDSDYFGPILAITSKILLGQKPSQSDYKNVGLGINMLLYKGINDGKLKGGIAAAFAEGGLVDPQSISAITEGGDISDWVAKAFKDSTDSNAQKTLKEIQDNLRLKKDGKGEEPTKDESLPGGTGALVGNTNAEKVFNYLIGYGFTEQAAAGVIGNLMQESGVNPNSKQLGGGPGRGIMQWGTGPGSGGRWDALVAWASSSGKDPWKLDTQVEWMMKEMRSYGTLSRLKGVTDVKKAVQIFEREMEKAGTPNYPRRYQYAADALSSFGGGKAGGVGIGKMDKGGVGGAIAEYITGDPNTPFGRFDKSGHGMPYNYHDHIAFRDRSTAVRAYKFFQSKGIQVTEFKGFNPVGGHAQGSYHYSGLAFDVPGAQWGGSGAIGQKDYSGSSRVRKVLKEFLGGGLVKLEKGGRVGGPTKALIGEKGTEFVFDADTTRGLDSFAPNLLEKLNIAKSKPQIAEILESYTSYESEVPQTIFVPLPDTQAQDEYKSEISGGVMFIGGGEESDPFANLYQGT